MKLLVVFPAHSRTHTGLFLPVVARRFLFLLLWVATSGATARLHAQLLEAKLCPLGAASAEINLLYGPVVKHNARVRHHQILEGGDSPFTGDLHTWRGLIVRTVYQKDRCVLLEYTRVDGALTTADVDSALAANAGAFAWEQGKDSTEASKYYRRSDGKAIAQWASGEDGSLLVTSEEADTGFGKDLVH